MLVFGWALCRLCDPIRAHLYFSCRSTVSPHISVVTLQKAEAQESSRRDRPSAPEEDLSEEDLPRVQEEVNDLQAQFDQAVVEKHSLEMELQSMKERLKAASDLIDR